MFQRRQREQYDALLRLGAFRVQRLWKPFPPTTKNVYVRSTNLVPDSSRKGISKAKKRTLDQIQATGIVPWEMMLGRHY